MYNIMFVWQECICSVLANNTVHPYEEYAHAGNIQVYTLCARCTQTNNMCTCTLACVCIMFTHREINAWFYSIHCATCKTL